MAGAAPPSPPLLASLRRRIHAGSTPRWWRSRSGRHTETHTILGEMYGWFTEGFELPDLKDARALLDELAT
jgi:hypothetical protein